MADWKAIGDFAREMSHIADVMVFQAKDKEANIKRSITSIRHLCDEIEKESRR